MDPKLKPNRALYIDTLRRMSPQRRLAIAIELSEQVRAMTLHGIRRRHPELDEAEVKSLFLAQIARCHNKNY